MKKIHVKLDSRNRVCLTKISKHLPSRFFAYEKSGTIILEPCIEVPQSEVWLFEPENKKILQQIKEGLRDTKEKKLINRGSFAKYLKSK